MNKKLLSLLLFFKKRYKKPAKEDRIQALRDSILGQDAQLTYDLGKKLLVSYPNDKVISWMTAWGAYKLGKFEELIGLIAPAIKEYPKKQKYLFWRATAYLKLERFIEAKKDFQQVIDIDPYTVLAQKSIEKIDWIKSRKSRQLSAIAQEAFGNRDYNKLEKILKDLYQLDEIIAQYYSLRRDDFLMNLKNPIKEWSKFIDKANQSHPKLAYTATKCKITHLLQNGEVDLALKEVSKIDEHYKKNFYEGAGYQLSLPLFKQGKFKQGLQVLDECEKYLDGDALATFQLRAFTYRYVANKMLSGEEYDDAGENPLSDALLDKMLELHHKESSTAQIIEMYQKHNKILKEIKSLIMLDIRWNPNQVKKFKERILSAVLSKSPFSLIRIGDGESYGFNMQVKDIFSNELTRNNENHWWNKSLDVKTRKKIIKKFLRSFKNVDVIGFPGPIRFARDFRVSKSVDRLNLQVARYKKIFQGTQQLLRKNKFNKDCWWVDEFCNTIFHNKKFISKLIDTADNVVLVTCFEAPKRSLLNNPKIKVISVPAARKVALITKDNFDGKVLPEIIDDIESQVKKYAKKGTLLLVSAGFAGKHLVSIGKECGAIALDVGSAIDYLFDLKTRNIDFYSQF